MGKQTSKLQVQGTVGNVCFYKSNGEYLVRSKGSVSKSKIKNHQSYARTRENMAEFTRAAQAGKLFRKAFHSLVVRVGKKGVANRLMKKMMQVIKADDVNSRGDRTVKDGQQQLLDGFEFNENITLTSRLRIPLNAVIDRRKGLMTVDIKAFSAGTAISAPEGATHFRLYAGGAAIDFENNAYDVETSESGYLPINRKKTSPIQLIQKIKPESSGSLFLLLGIEFLTLLNGKESRLDNGLNALAIVKVSGK